MQTKPSVLLLDIGDVLLEIAPERFDEMLECDCIGEIRDHYLHDAYERGQISSDEFFSGIQSEFKLNGTRERVEEAWLATIKGEVPGVVDVLMPFVERVPTYILSNTNESHIRNESARYPLLKHVKKMFTSFELACRKPEPEIYQKAIQGIDMPAVEILFIDDKKENLEAAQQQGMQVAQVVRSAQNLAEILQRSFP